MSDSKPKQTMVDEGTELSGTIRSAVPIVILGRIDGDVTSPAITVAPSGSLAGKVKVKDLTSEGEISGEIEAETVKISGKVRDKSVIRSKTLHVALVTEKGVQVVFGDVELSVGDAPDKQAAINAAGGASVPASPRPATVPRPS